MLFFHVFKSFLLLTDHCACFITCVDFEDCLFLSLSVWSVEWLYGVSLHAANGSSESNSSGGGGSSGRIQWQLRPRVRGRSVRGCASSSGGGRGCIWSGSDGDDLQRRIQPVCAILNSVNPLPDSLWLWYFTDSCWPQRENKSHFAKHVCYEQTLNKECNYINQYMEESGWFFKETR